MMKEQWKISNGEAVLCMEESLQQENREKPNCCKRWIYFIKLILYLELVLFFGWSFCTIIQTYRFQIAINEFTDVTHERYPPLFESEPEVQLNTEIPVVFVKPEIILNKLNRLLEDMELNKKQDLTQDKTISAAADNVAYTSTRSPIIVQDENVVQVESIDGRLLWRIRDSKTPEYIDESHNTDQNEESIRHMLFLKKLGIIDVEKPENKNDLTEDINPPIPNFQEIPALDASDESKRLGPDLTSIFDLVNSMNPEISVSLTNNEQGTKQRLPDFIENAGSDRNEEESTINDKSDEHANIDLELGHSLGHLPYESRESSDTSKYFPNYFTILQHVAAQRTSEQIESEESDKLSAAAARNKDSHDVDDSNVSMSTSLDMSASKSDTLRFLFDKPMAIVQNTKDQLSPEIIPSNIKEDEKHGSMDDIKNLFEPERDYLSLSMTYDGEESSMLDTEEFKWFNPSAHFANDLPEGPKDAPELNKDPSPSHIDICTLESSFYEKLDSFSYEFFMDLNKLICDKSSETKADMTSQQATPKIIDATESQESISNAGLNDVLLYLRKITNVNSLGGTQDHQDDKMEQTGSSFITEHNSEFKSVSDTVDSEKDWISPFKISDTQIEDQRRSNQVQMITGEGQGFMNSGDVGTSVELYEDISDLKKELNSTFLKELKDYMKTSNYNPREFRNKYVNRVCGPYRLLLPLYNWCLRYINTYALNVHYDMYHDDPSDDTDDSVIYRKKRMVNGLNVQPDEQTSNGLEENNKSDIPLNITIRKKNNEKAKSKQEKPVPRMKVSAARSNKLRLDEPNAGYALNKLPAMVEKRREQ